MSWAIRRAAPEDAALLAEHRAAVWREHGNWDEAVLAAQIPVWTAFFADLLAEDRYVAWIAHAGSATVGSGSLLVNLIIPQPGHPGDRFGRVQSLYVVPAARRRGIARALMHELLDYARSALFVRLVLHPSEEGRALYAELGFRPVDEMALRLEP